MASFSATPRHLLRQVYDASANLSVFLIGLQIPLANNSATICLIAVCFSAFLFYSATFRETNSRIEEYYENIHHGLETSDLKAPILTTIIMTIPMLVDITSDFPSLFVSRSAVDNVEKRHWLIRVTLFATFSVPYAFLYGSVEGMSKKATYYLCTVGGFVPAAQGGCILAFMSIDHRNLGIALHAIATVFLYIIGQYCNLQAALHLPFSATSVIYEKYKTAGIVCSSFAYLLFIYVVMTWLLSCVRSKKNHWSHYDLAVLLYTTSIILITVFHVSYSMRSEGSADPYGPKSLTSQIASLYMQLGFNIMIMILPGRITHLKLADTSKKMEDRQAFVRYISHEIRTPLNTAFLGLTYILEELRALSTRSAYPNLRGEDGNAVNLERDVVDTVDMILETVEDVSNSCQVALSILNELLTLDKIESGKMTLDMEAVHPQQYITEVVRVFSAQAREKDIDFNIIFAGVSNDRWMDMYALFIDQTKLGQVIRNLVSNAFKFTPRGGRVMIVAEFMGGESTGIEDESESARSDGRRSRLWNNIRAFFRPAKQTAVGLEPAAEGAGGGGEVRRRGKPRIRPEEPMETPAFIRIKVVDNGAGISEENQRRLFGQYVQFDAAKLQKGGGSGLGLWISKGIVELHGGKIGAHSEGEGTGTTFFVDLPAHRWEEVTKFKNATSSPSKSQSTKPNSLMRMLFSSRGFVQDFTPQPVIQREKAFLESADFLVPPSVKGSGGPGSHSSSAVQRSRRRIMGGSGASSARNSGPRQREISSIFFRKDNIGLRSLPIGIVPGGDHNSAVGGHNSGSTSGKQHGVGSATPILAKSGFPSSLQMNLGRSAYNSSSCGEKRDEELAAVAQYSPRFSPLELGGTPRAATALRNELLSSNLRMMASNYSFQSRLLDVDTDLALAGHAGSSSGGNGKSNSTPSQVAGKSGSTPSQVAGKSSSSQSQGNGKSSSTPSQGSRLSSIRSLRQSSRSRHLGVAATAADFSNFGVENGGRTSHHDASYFEELRFHRGSSVGAVSQASFTMPQSYDQSTGYHRTQEDWFAVALLAAHTPPGNRITSGQVDGGNTACTTTRPFLEQAVSDNSNAAVVYRNPLRLRGSLTATRLPAASDGEEESVTIPVRHEMNERQEERCDTEEAHGNSEPRCVIQFMVVDDSAPTRKVVKRLLAKDGHVVIEAADGEECLQKFEEMEARGETVDVVLMDDNMPKMSGQSATKALRDLGYQGIICAVTGNTSDNDIESFLKAGATEVLTKPLDLQLLRALLSRSLTF